MRVPAVLLCAWLLTLPACGKDDGSHDVDGGAEDAGDGLDADLRDAAAADAAIVISSDTGAPTSRIDPARIPQSFD
ncbi:MAG TPA: hypothetical protein VFZ61_27430, partial [Polyangiales bacterium]